MSSRGLCPGSIYLQHAPSKRPWITMDPGHKARDDNMKITRIREPRRRSPRISATPSSVLDHDHHSGRGRDGRHARRPARHRLRLLLHRALRASGIIASASFRASWRPTRRLIDEKNDNLDPFAVWKAFMANEKPGGHGDGRTPPARSTWPCGTRPPKSRACPCGGCFPSVSMPAAHDERCSSIRAAATTTRARSSTASGPRCAATRPRATGSSR